jgi:uncharacterized membrane protein YedE/YeeE
MSELFNTVWPWYIAGPLIGLMVPALLLFDNRQFGISSTLRDFCAFVRPGSLDYFKYNLKDQIWRNVLVLGVLIGGILAVVLSPDPIRIGISPATVSDLQELGIHNFKGFVPEEIFSWNSIFSLNGLIFIIAGGFLIGFGTRWADGCTAGHAITGLSLLSPASLIAVLGFFIGGLTATHLLFPLILN